tara:strand:- start:744 stop:974 length:231 start_codon:yes stop_codon:yes gene_type:complete
MIRACIFDLGGTIVDKYSLTPLLSFKQIFASRGINVSHKMVIKDMGKHKYDHINIIDTLYELPYIIHHKNKINLKK